MAAKGMRARVVEVTTAWQASRVLARGLQILAVVSMTVSCRDWSFLGDSQGGATSELPTGGAQPSGGRIDVLPTLGGRAGGPLGGTSGERPGGSESAPSGGTAHAGDSPAAATGAGGVATPGGSPSHRAGTGSTIAGGAGGRTWGAEAGSPPVAGTSGSHSTGGNQSGIAGSALAGGTSAGGGTSPGGANAGSMIAGQGGATLATDSGGMNAGRVAGGRGGSTLVTDPGGEGPGGASGQGGGGPDPDHCGAPGRACGTTNVLERRCTDGVCTSTCQTGYWNVTLPAAPEADDGCESSCPASLGGPDLVRLRDGYCIDSTEVSLRQYQEWLESAPDPRDQADDCDWNVSFAPSDYCLSQAEEEGHYDNEDYPVVCVDWCDASAYCKAMGKRLCGRIGGGSVSWEAYRDVESSQWYNACVSGDSERRYPYGKEYMWSYCNGYEYEAGAWLPVGSLRTCQSSVEGYGGVYDLSGNVWEWEDCCDDGHCRIRGGSYANRIMLVCHADNEPPREPFYVHPHIGFRCCSDGS